MRRTTGSEGGYELEEQHLQLELALPVLLCLPEASVYFSPGISQDLTQLRTFANSVSLDKTFVHWLVTLSLFSAER